MVDDADLKEAIRNGATSATEIAECIDRSTSATRRRLKKAVESEASPLTRERAPRGSGYVYGIADAEGGGDTGEMPVFGDREYDWSQFVPSADATEYVETAGELADIEAIIDERHQTGQLPRFRLTGPPGTGKTTLARHIGAARQWPVIPIQFTAAMRDSELFGSPHIIGGESVWVDGPLVKALLCSQVRPVVVVLDEVNRAPFHRKSSLQPFLDHRAQATLQIRGGEVIEGDPQNLITVATMNQGAEYETFPIDPAERRRHANTYAIPFLGLVDADREAALVAEESPVTADLARVFVAAANDVRRLAQEDPSSPIEKGIATSLLLEWARTGVAYQRSGRPNPLGRAARSAIVRPHYQDAAAEAVQAVLKDAVSGTDGAGAATAAGTGD